jgi:YD repeat-containing protein
MGQTVSYKRDLLGRVTVKNADGDETHYTYDPAGRLVAAATLESELVLQRDRMGRPRTEMYEGRILALDRDALGRPVRRITPTGAVTTYAYDAAGNRVGLGIDGHTLDFAFDAAGRETRRHVDTALTWANQWDPAGRLLTRTVTADGVTGDPRAEIYRQRGGAVVQEQAYEYRTDGCLTGVSDRLNGTRRFRLDRAGRVTQVTGEGWTETYAYDTAGNLTQATWPTSHGESALGEREFNGTRLHKAGRWTYVHDEAGRVIERRKTRLSRKPDVWRYAWDAEDHLTACTTPDGITWRYRYDPLGRRTAKQRLDADGKVAEETVFTWDGIQVIEQTTTTPAGAPSIALTWDYDGLAPVVQTERALDPETQQVVDARFFAIITDLVGTPTEWLPPMATSPGGPAAPSGAPPPWLAAPPPTPPCATPASTRTRRQASTTTSTATTTLPPRVTPARTLSASRLPTTLWHGSTIPTHGRTRPVSPAVRSLTAGQPVRARTSSGGPKSATTTGSSTPDTAMTVSTQGPAG